MRLSIYLFVATVLLCACSDGERKTVICVPVYGQSLALGEEAEQTTDMDSLNDVYGGRIVSENMDGRFGFYHSGSFTRAVKRFIGYGKRRHEVSVYALAERIADRTGSDTLLCVFADGQGATPIDALLRGSAAYKRLMADICHSHDLAERKGYGYIVPAVCWMQGESDMYDYTHADYKALLRAFARDVNDDIQGITGQEDEVVVICYQTNLVSVCDSFRPYSYDCTECVVPQAQMELVRDNDLFVPGTPTYPLTFVRENKHIDAVSQRLVGHYNALALLDVLAGRQHDGVLPLTAVASGEREVRVTLSVPAPPLVIDTVTVATADGYGFTVVTADGRNILDSVCIDGNDIVIACTDSVKDCRVRYAVNGTKGKSGRINGSRGNIRDSQGDGVTASIDGYDYPLHNWCWQFDMPVQ